MELAFSEDDYSTQEGPGSTINAQITKSGQSSEAVTVRVVPMTFEQYRSRFGQIPYQDIDPAEGEKMCMALLGGTENEIASLGLDRLCSSPCLLFYSLIPKTFKLTYYALQFTYYAFFMLPISLQKLYIPQLKT